MSKEEYEALMRRLKAIEEKLNQSSPMDEVIWFDNDQVCNYLKISKRTLQSYRDKQLVEFRQVGAKIWYKYQWIIDFLEKHGKP